MDWQLGSMNTDQTRSPNFPTLIFLSGLSVVSMNMFLPSLPSIAAEFEADYALVNLAIAGYAAMTVVLQLIAGPLSDRYGRRPIILGALSIFIIASVGCQMAADIVTFLIFRMLQAVVISGIAVSMAVVRDTHDERAAAGLIGKMASIWAFGPMLGPVLGGYLDQTFGWRANFSAFAAFGMVAFALSWWLLPETNQQKSRNFTEQFRTYPLLLTSHRFWSYALCMAFSVGAFYAFLSGIPLVSIHEFGMAPAAIGVAMGTITVGFVFGSYLSGRLATRSELLHLILAGRIIACGGLGFGLLLYFSGNADAIGYLFACSFVGIGNGLTMPSTNAGAMSVRPDLAGSAAGLFGALVASGGALMSAVTGMVVTADNSGPALLLVMLLSSAVGLLFALYLMRLNQKPNLGTP